MDVNEIITENNKNRTTWAVYTRHTKYGLIGDRYVGTIQDSRIPEEIAREICVKSKRKNYDIKIGAIIIL